MTGTEPATPPAGSQTGQAPQAGSTGSTGAAGTTAEPGASDRTETGAGSTAAGQGVRGAETASAGTGRTSLRSVAAKGELPFSGLELAEDLALGLSLLLVGLFTRALSAAEGRRI
jgi:hypothetical protein